MISFWLLTGVLSAQVSSDGSEQGRLLEVRQRQIELREARTELARVQRLFDEGLSPRTSLGRAQTAVERAQLAYQQSLLTLLSVQPRLSISKAVKHQDREGGRFIRLTVVNLTPTLDDSDFTFLKNFEGADPLPEAFKNRDLSDIIISLKDTGESSTGEGSSRGVTIALPYEVYISELQYGDSRTLEFQLLRDVNSVVVATSHRGTTRELDIQLEQAETQNAVTVSSTQISQEADLGSDATFDLRLERSTLDVRSYHLAVLNLPRQMSRRFIDPQTQARLSRINFPAGVSELSLGLTVFLPERSTEAVKIDQPLTFWAVVTDDGESLNSDKDYSLAEIQESRAGFVGLEIIPRGIGELEVLANSLFSEIAVGDEAVDTITLRNSGTRRLDNVRMDVEHPLNWLVQVEPEWMQSLEVNEECEVSLRIAPAPGAPVGDYEIRITTQASAYNRPVPVERKIYRVSLQSPPAFLGAGVLLTVLLVVVSAIVVLGVKFSRR